MSALPPIAAGSGSLLGSGAGAGADVCGAVDGVANGVVNWISAAFGAASRGTDPVVSAAAGAAGRAVSFRTPDPATDPKAARVTSPRAAPLPEVGGAGFGVGGTIGGALVAGG